MSKIPTEILSRHWEEFKEASDEKGDHHKKNLMQIAFYAGASVAFMIINQSSSKQDGRQVIGQVLKELDNFFTNENEDHRKKKAH